MSGFLNLVWDTLQPVDLNRNKITDLETLNWLHRAIKKVTNNIKRFSYITALALIMELLNHINEAEIKNQCLAGNYLAG
jgi:hypothetical protein